MTIEDINYQLSNLREDVEYLLGRTEQSDIYLKALDMAMSALRVQQEAEKNEPTRCMDCVNWKPGETMGGIKTGQIERLGECKFIRGAFMATDFCSRAKCRQKEAHNV